MSDTHCSRSLQRVSEIRLHRALCETLLYQFVSTAQLIIQLKN